jgi:hypothetical protein
VRHGVGGVQVGVGWDVEGRTCESGECSCLMFQIRLVVFFGMACSISFQLAGREQQMFSLKMQGMYRSGEPATIRNVVFSIRRRPHTLLFAQERIG